MRASTSSPTCECNYDDSPVCPSCGAHSDSSVHLYDNTPKGSLKLKEQPHLPELDRFKFSQGMKAEMTDIFYSATGHKTRRKAPRRAMIFLAIVHVCKASQVPFDKNDLMKSLDITDRHVNTAMKEMHIPPKAISVADVLKDLMAIFNVKDTLFETLLETYERCKRTSIIFNSAKPDTIASGLLYYHLKTGLGDVFNQDSYFAQTTVSRDSILAVYADISKVIG
jgi:hypothetical protein